MPGPHLVPVLSSLQGEPAERPEQFPHVSETRAHVGWDGRHPVGPQILRPAELPDQFDCEPGHGRPLSPNLLLDCAGATYHRHEPGGRHRPEMYPTISFAPRLPVRGSAPPDRPC